MYVAILLLLLGAAVALAVHGVRRRSRGGVITGALLFVGTLLFFGLLSFWGEVLWFRYLGYEARLWREILARTAFGLAGAAFGALFLYLLTLALPRGGRTRWGWPEAVGALLGAVAGVTGWDEILRFWYGVPTGVKEPILGRDTSFYLFTLPLLDHLFALLLFLSFFALAAAAAALLMPLLRSEDSAEPDRPALDLGRMPEVGALFLAAGAIVLVLSFGIALGIFHLMFSRHGVVHGPGWTDVHIRLPGHIVAAAFTALVGVFLVIPPAWRRLLALCQRRFGGQTRAMVLAIGAPAAACFAIWAVALLLLPGLVHWLKVSPNEITLERPYLRHNIQFTRMGFDLQKVEVRRFPAVDRFTPQMVRDNQDILSEIRLWDPGALQAVFKQFQEIRLYYEFSPLDVDRYRFNDRYRQVMVSAREMAQQNLPAQSQTFVNRRFKYTHGQGVVLAPVSEFTEDGLPEMLVKDIPPQAAFPALRVTRPEIYFGEQTTEHVVANSAEPEFDYPLGDDNVYTHYQGTGGVPLDSAFRKFLFGWKMDGTRFLLSSYPTRQSRVLFHRQIRERLRLLAPFLDYDHDPYIVIHEGRLVWIIDAYTTSRYFPYSEPFFAGEFIETREDRGEGGRQIEVGGDRRRLLSGGPGRAYTTAVAGYLSGASYVRNSVKAVVDAYNGDVTFYVFAPDDPIVQTWSKIFPGLFRGPAEMPPDLRAHVRYPEGYLLTQGIVYAKYHMDDPDMFYKQEDLWVRATERYYDQIRPVDPYYIMWRPPGEQGAEFVVMMPFTPKGRQVLIGWIAGLCDGENYGRLLAYKFPKEKLVIGTQQVDTKIDQDPTLSAQLSLWDQRGSRVIRGNVLVIPIEEALLYVEPIYLQAEAAAYPELRMVVLMQGNRMAYAPTFEEALRGLLGEAPAQAAPPGEAGPAAELARQASEAFSAYLRLQGELRFVEAAQQMEALRRALEQLSAQQRPAERARRPLPALER